MRAFIITTCLAAGLASAGAGVARAQDADQKPIYARKGMLTDEDNKDKVIRGAFAKAHSIKLEAGKTYRIEMTSTEVDPYLRLENADGKPVAADDDGGGYPNARIIYKAAEDGKHRLIATTFPSPMGTFKLTGSYEVSVSLATPVDIIEFRAKTIARASPAERDATVEDFKKYLKDLGPKLSKREAQLATMVAYTLETRDADNTIPIYRDFAKLMAAAADPKVAGLSRMFEGCVRRIQLPGKTMDDKGKTADGKDFDLAKLKGKVVLVDFWATWCRPCIGEIPNMQKMYEAYHERGFEIIAISTDQGIEAPTRFMEKRMLPWPWMHDEPDEPTSLAGHYGVLSIPRAILVGRDGKVVSLNARGPELERLLE
ncbi:MAG: TlpA family protein disulfide reductase [Gemmataceae bacterium]|nr:TlpA family protein disulfide reductase [Gemmataceae bacterium]